MYIYYILYIIYYIYLPLKCHIFGHMAQAMACHGWPTVVPVRREGVSLFAKVVEVRPKASQGIFDDAMPGAANPPAVEFTKPFLHIHYCIYIYAISIYIYIDI